MSTATAPASATPPAPVPVSSTPRAPAAPAAASNIKSLEIRFGLVMYGGVSLAIYIDGVSHEFFRAVHGNGVYRLVKQLADVDLGVDIISGSSAGGINGIFLSYALANGKDFAPIAALWRELGGVKDLLWPVETPAASCKSLFDSDGNYQGQIREALAGLPDYQAAPLDDPTTVEELDLFVTGTDVDGNVYTTVDEDGHMIDVKEHRRLFALKHRPHRPTPTLHFEPSDANHHALARLARITSSFPGAFAPVAVAAAGGEGAGPTDEALRGWGAFAKKSYLIDGGVLDNKPFSPTFRAIRSRPADGPVLRQLCYVEPDPDYFPEGPIEEPSFLATIVGGAAGIKGYESIADDLKMIASHNAQVERYWQVCTKMRGQLPVWSYDAVDRNGVVLPEEATLFALNEATAGTAPPEALRRDPPRVASFFPEALREQYARSRFSAIGARSLRGTLRDSRTGQPVAIDRSKRDRVAALIDALHAMEADGNQILTKEESLFRFDVYFRQRRLQHVSCRIAEAIRNEVDPVRIARLRALAHDLGDHAQAAEIICHWMEYVMDRAQIAWEHPSKPAQTVWNEVRWSLEELLLLDPSSSWHLTASPAGEAAPARARREQENREALGKLHACLKKRAEQICAYGSEQARPLRPAFDGILAVADRGARAVLQQSQYNGEPGLRDELAQYVGLDAMVYPLELVSGLAAKEPIRILRISPRDAKAAFCDRPIEDKIAGKALAHFGGFFKRSWRSNDILWGRLDALCELVENVLTQERLSVIASTPALREKVRGRFLRSESVGALFPRSAGETSRKVHDWIFAMFGDDANDRARQLERTHEMRVLIVEMAQLELISECVPQVIEDAAAEQQSWNQYAMPATSKKRPAQPNDKIGAAMKRALATAASRAAGTRAAGLAEPDVLRVCVQAAVATGRDHARMRAIFDAIAADDSAFKAIWSPPDPVRPGRVAGDRLIDRAIRASYRTSVEGELKARDTFRATRGFVDPALAAAAAAEYARASLAVIDGEGANAAAARPWDSPLGRFFRQKYSVGSEELWRDIPALVLIEIFAHAALVLRQCVTESLPPELRKRVRGHLLFRFGLDLPLRWTYWVIRFARQASATYKVLAGVVATAALSLLALSAWRGKSLLYEQDHISLSSLFWLVVVPLLVLWALVKAIVASTRAQYAPAFAKVALVVGIVTAFFVSPLHRWASVLAGQLRP